MRMLDLLTSCGINYADIADPTAPVLGVTCFPACVRAGWIFVNCEVPWQDPESGFLQAKRRGAALIISARDVPGSNENVVHIQNVNVFYAQLCSAFYETTSYNTPICAITGTKGKTTTCHILDNILKHAGRNPGLISSICRRIGATSTDSPCTTPEPSELHLLLHRMQMEKATDIIIEASSIGLAEDRLHGLRFEAVAFTNLGSDHLTYHGGLVQYRAAKAKLFTEFAALHRARPLCVVNIDDEFGQALASMAKSDVITFGMDRGDVKPSRAEFTGTGIYMDILSTTIQSQLLGRHNVYNILCAIALAYGLGIEIPSIATGISELAGIPGRLQRVFSSTDTPAFVDYAHTPESIDAVLTTLRSIYPSRDLIVVLGCGGGTDRNKRPVMAALAESLADVCILTADNPRQEDAAEIVDEMLSQRPVCSTAQVEVVLDRNAAIMRAVALARARNGVIALLGRGSERFQQCKGRTIPFCDEDKLAQALNTIRN